MPSTVPPDPNADLLGAGDVVRADAPQAFLEPGTPVTIDNCEREPIHLPGAVQPHGAVLVADADQRIVNQVSANVGDFFPAGVDAVIGRSLDELLGVQAADGFALAPEAVGDGPIRPSRLILPSGQMVDAHSFRPAVGLIAVEIEPVANTLVDEPGSLTRVTRWSAALQAQPTTEAIAAVAARAMRELTGFHRVWAYRFEDDDHGVVIAEDCEPHLDRFLGLHFPESDIPRQARALYLQNPVRTIPDVAAIDAPLVPARNPSTDDWLDLSAGTLRAVSPMHVRYLANMGVGASMSVSLVVGGRLWGLLSAHHYGAPRRVPAVVRGECELLGIVVAMQLATGSELDRTRRGLEAQRSATRVLDAVAAADSLAAGLVAGRDDLLGLCDATGAIISVGGRRQLIGSTPAAAGAVRILEAVAGAGDALAVTDSLAQRHPALADLAEEASGAIAAQLASAPDDWIVWLRPESTREVTWGNRDKELVRREPGGELQLGQRESFERWVELVHGRSRPWHAAEIETVAGFRESLGALLVARRAQHAKTDAVLAAAQAEQDAFATAAAHDLREPVRGIEQFADFFLEDYATVLDDGAKAQVQTIMRLAGRMDSLLSSLMDYAHVADVPAERGRVYLPTVVAEVRELLAGRVSGDLQLDVQPAWVDGDQHGVRQLLFNLIWNAIKYSDGPPRIRVGTTTLAAAERGTERAPRTTARVPGPVVVAVRDEGIGIAPEHHEAIFEIFRRLHLDDEYGGGSGAGLALCKRIVARHGGTIWVDSTPGAGSTFYFTLAPA